MSTSRHINKICLVILAITLAITILFMNGERLGIQAVADEDAENYSGSEYFTTNDLDGDWSTAHLTTITLDGDSAKVSGTGAYFYEGDVVIVQSGYYEISGTLTDGSLVVEAEDYSKVWIRLAGTEVYCSDDAALRIDQADKVFLTLASDTENSLASGAEMSEEALADGTGGAIYAHDDLTINGSGSLTVTAEYQHGIEANDELTITGGTIAVTAPSDGINVNDGFYFTAADLVISAGDDGIHSETAVYIQDGEITINECYEGIEGTTVEMAGGDVTIYPTDDGINANGGSTTGMGAMGGGMMGGPGMQMTEQTDQTGESAEEETYIRIDGGNLTIVNTNGRDADGLDSNGNIYINGGTVRVFLNGSGGNNAIDYASESGGIVQINGGTLIAGGGANMIEEIDDSSTQVSIMYNGTTVSAGSSVALLDADGKELLSGEVPCEVSSVTFSCPELQSGETYTVALGDTTADVTIEEMAQTIGGGNMGMGGMGGQMMPGGGPQMQGGGPQMPGGGPQMQGGRPQMQAGDQQVQTDEQQAQTAADGGNAAVAADGTVSVEAWLLIAICAGTLLAGILIAAVFRAKNG